MNPYIVHSAVAVVSLGAAIGLYTCLPKKNKSQDLKNSQVCHRCVEVHKDVIGFLIGVNGKAIKDIIFKTGVKMKFTCHDASDDYTLCHIKGSEEKVREALNLLNLIIIQFDDTKLTSNDYANECQNTNLLNVPVNNSKSFPSTEDSLIEYEIDFASRHTQEIYLSNKVERVSIIVSAIVSPSMFWVQAVKSKEYEQLKYLELAMTNYYNNISGKKHRLKHSEIKPGVICAGFVNDAWYRIEIREVSPRDIDIFLLDYGISEFLTIDYLRSMPKRFLELKFQAIECTLWKIKPKDHDDWSQSAITSFEEITHVGEPNIILSAIINNPDKNKCKRNCLEIELLDSSVGYDLNIADSLVRLGFAKYVEIYFS